MPVHARHYATGEPVLISWAAHQITAIQPCRTSEISPLPWIAPPLVDLQVNGFAGIDFQQDNLTADALLRAIEGLNQAGCARFFLTLITDEWDRLLRRLQDLHRLRSHHPELSNAIAGWHIEGPFLSGETGYRGAHDPEFISDPSTPQIQQLRAAVSEEPLLLTLAPERPGAIEAIQTAVELGCMVCLGHTNASSPILDRACRAGAAGFTHLGNACPQLLDRHDNILWRVLDLPGIHVSLIPDAIHVSPPFFRLLHRLLHPARILYISDATAAAGAPPGSYNLGRLEIQVGADQIVRQPGQPNFAGSALRPIDGVFRAAQMLNVSWREVWDRFSVQPAAFAGMDVALRVGGPADFCLLGFEGATLSKLGLFRGGQEIV